MLLLKNWWSLEACKACSEHNGGCQCEKTGICKSLEHDAARAAGISSPFIQDKSLSEFYALVRNAIVLSSLGRGVPTLEALSWFEIPTPYDTKTTQEMIFMIYQDMLPRR